jgi:hypothetical protein
MSYKQLDVRSPDEEHCGEYYAVSMNLCQGYETKYRRGVVGVNLTRDSDSFIFSWDYWDAMLALAKRFGWVPMGTVPIKDFDSVWMPPVDTETEQRNRRRIEERLRTLKCDYQSGNVVLTTDDARSIADALDRALEEAAGDDLIVGRTLEPDEDTAGVAISQRRIVQEFRDFLKEGFCYVW